MPIKYKSRRRGAVGLEKKQDKSYKEIKRALNKRAKKVQEEDIVEE